MASLPDCIDRNLISGCTCMAMNEYVAPPQSSCHGRPLSLRDLVVALRLPSPPYRLDSLQARRRAPKDEQQLQRSITMAFFTAASKADFQHQLQAALAQHVSDKALPQVALFAEQFFGIVSLDELTQRRMSDLAGCTLSSWRLLER